MRERVFQTVSPLAGRLGGCLAVALAMSSTGHAETPARSRLAIIGPADVVLYGQAGYCGSMAAYDKADTGGALIDGGKRVWIRLRHRRDCVGDFSFVPEPGRAYILRAGTPGRVCVAGLFLVNPGATPTPAPMKTEGRRSCLLPWNHEPEPEPEPEPSAAAEAASAP